LNRERGNFLRCIAGYQSFGGAANNDDATNYFTASNDLSWGKGAAIFRSGRELRIYRDDLYNWLPEDPLIPVFPPPNGSRTMAVAQAVGLDHAKCHWQARSNRR
jgi:hypothetical protein